MLAETQAYVPVDTIFQKWIKHRERLAGVLPSNELLTEAARMNQYQALRNLIYTTTPLTCMDGPNGSHLLRKWESHRPTRSHYDPVYFETFRALEQDYKVVRPGDIFYEVSSGNAGTSFTWLGSRLGFKTHLFVPAALPRGRVQESVNFGSNLVRVSGDSKTELDPNDQQDLAYVAEASRAMVGRFLAKAREEGFGRVPKIEDDNFNLFLRRHPDGRTMVLVNHSENMVSPRSMSNILAEVKRVAPPSTRVDYVISAIGNGSSSMGLSMGIDKYYPGAKLIGVENQDTAVLYREKHPNESRSLPDSKRPQKMYGMILPGMKLPFATADLFDDILLVHEKEVADRMFRYNFGRPIIETIGMSSAACMIVAEQVAASHPGSTVLSLIYDGADRYGEPVVYNPLDIRTNPLDEYRIMPLRVPWVQPQNVDFSSMPKTLRQAYQQIYWMGSTGSLVPLDSLSSKA